MSSLLDRASQNPDASLSAARELLAHAREQILFHDGTGLTEMIQLATDVEHVYWVRGDAWTSDLWARIGTTLQRCLGYLPVATHRTERHVAILEMELIALTGLRATCQVDWWLGQGLDPVDAIAAAALNRNADHA